MEILQLVKGVKYKIEKPKTVFEKIYRVTIKEGGKKEEREVVFRISEDGIRKIVIREPDVYGDEVVMYNSDIYALILALEKFLKELRPEVEE